MSVVVVVLVVVHALIAVYVGLVAVVLYLAIAVPADVTAAFRRMMIFLVAAAATAMSSLYRH